MPSPWSIKGIPQEARAAAKAAAQRQGMTLGAWIVSKIEEEAGPGGAGVEAPLREVNSPALASPAVEAPLPTAASAPAAAMTPQAMTMAAPSAADPGTAALHVIAQALGQSRVEAENQAIAALQARIDALAEITESLSRTVSESLQTVEDAREKARLAETVAASAAETAEAGRAEAALSMRASAAVAEKALAALGENETPVEENYRKLEEALHQRLDQIENRISESEDEGARQFDTLSDTVARTEQMLEQISARQLGFTDHASHPAPEAAAEPEAPFASDPQMEAEEEIIATDGDVLEVGDTPRAMAVESIDAPGLRERIRNRLQAGELVNENIRAAEQARYFDPVDAIEPAEAPAEEEQHASEDQPQEPSTRESAQIQDGRSAERKSGSLSFGSWFRRPESRETPANAQSFSDEVTDLTPADAPVDQVDAEPMRDQDLETSGQTALPTSAAQEPVFNLMETMEASNEDDAEEPPFAADHASADAEEDDFGEAIERARRQREMLRSQEESDPLASDAALSSAYPAQEDQEPLTLGPAEELPRRAGASSPYDAETGEPAFWGEIDEVDPMTAASGTEPAAGHGAAARAMTESAGVQSRSRSILSSEVWPFEGDSAMEGARERALRDESGSVGFGVAMTMAFIGLTAGAAMAALYQLGV